MFKRTLTLPARTPPASLVIPIRAGIGRQTSSISLTVSLSLVACLVTSISLWDPSRWLLDSQVVQPALEVRTTVAMTGELIKSLRISGTVETLHYAAIRAPELRGPRDVGWTSLTLTQIADMGSLVEAGSVVAEFDLERLARHIEDRRSRLAVSKSQLKKRRAEILAIQASEHQRRLEIRSELEKALLSLRLAEVRSAIEAEILRIVAEEARAVRKQREREGRLKEVVHAADLQYLALEVKKEALHVKRHQHDYDSLRVRAPIGGMVTWEVIFNSNGEFARVKAGDQIYPGTFFMRIVDISQMIVRSAVNQVDARSIRVGNAAVVRLDAYPGLQFAARVADLAPVVSAGSGELPFARGRLGNFVGHIPTRLLIDGEDERILPGLSASADVMVSAGQSGVLIPREALRYELGQKAGEFVYVMYGNEFCRRVVEVHDLSDTEALIQSGLEPGERVLLSSLPEDHDDQAH